MSGGSRRSPSRTSPRRSSPPWPPSTTATATPIEPRPGSIVTGRPPPPCEDGVALLGLPEHDLDDRQSGLDGPLIDEAGDILGGRVLVHDEDALAVLPEDGEDRVVAPQQHVVIEVVVDPALDLGLDLDE